MITYSTNFMGPISMEWYRDRGLTRMVEKTCESEIVRNMLRNSKKLKYLDIEIGDTYELEEIAVSYAGGRIDIRGLDEEDYYNGWDEYGLGVMHGEDWDLFSDWLDDLATTEQLGYDTLISTFEAEVLNGRKIRWADDITD